MCKIINLFDLLNPRISLFISIIAPSQPSSVGEGAAFPRRRNGVGN